MMGRDWEGATDGLRAEGPDGGGRSGPALHPDQVGEGEAAGTEQG